MQSPGPRFNIKMSSYQYRKFHCGGKTAVRSSYLHIGISYTGKTTSLYWIRALLFKLQKNVCSRIKLYGTHNRICHIGKESYNCKGPVVRCDRDIKRWSESVTAPSNISEIWQASRQQCCRDTCQYSEQYDYFDIQSRSYETWRYLKLSGIIAFWGEALYAICPIWTRCENW